MRLTIPILNRASIRRERIKGRDYLIVPMTLLRPTVLNGSKGPLLYDVAEIRASVAHWENMPLVVDHPFDSFGTPISAASPEVPKIGTVRNARIRADGSLAADGFFDVKKTKAVDIRIVKRLLNNEPIELSTGLFTTNEPRQGVHDGKRYIAIAKNYTPDHLAILPDSVGACALSDGCGVLVGNKCSCPKCNSKKKRKTAMGKRDRFIDEPVGNGEPLVPPTLDFSNCNPVLNKGQEPSLPRIVRPAKKVGPYGTHHLAMERHRYATGQYVRTPEEVTRAFGELADEEEAEYDDDIEFATDEYEDDVTDEMAGDESYDDEVEDSKPLVPPTMNFRADWERRYGATARKT